MIYVNDLDLPNNFPTSLVESVCIENLKSLIGNQTISTDADGDLMLKKKKSKKSIVYKKKQIITVDKAMEKGKYKKMLVKDEHCHGFMRPFSTHQKASWFVFGFNLFLEGLAQMPLLEKIIDVYGWPNIIPFLVVIFVILDIVVLGFAVITTMTDPSDIIVRYERFCKITNQHFPEDQYELFCQWCDCHVQEGTKHCGRCNRCTKEFDHHC